MVKLTHTYFYKFGIFLTYNIFKILSLFSFTYCTCMNYSTSIASCLIMLLNYVLNTHLLAEWYLLLLLLYLLLESTLTECS